MHPQTGRACVYVVFYDFAGSDTGNPPEQEGLIQRPPVTLLRKSVTGLKAKGWEA